MIQHFGTTTSERIREKIKETGIKQAHLAQKLGISSQHLNKILSKNQEKSQYIPKMAEILGMEESILAPASIQSIPILLSHHLQSLADSSMTWDNLDGKTFKSCTTFLHREYYLFGYTLTENINTHYLKDDRIIFSTHIPLKMTNLIGIVLIKEKALIFTGTLKYTQGTIMIYNEHDCFMLQKGDLLFGIATFLERNMERI